MTVKKPKPDFTTLLAEARAFRRKRKNPESELADAFAEHLLDKGYKLTGLVLPEEELRGVAGELAGDDEIARESWLEDFAAWTG